MAKVSLNRKRSHRGPTAPALLSYMIRHATLLKVLPVRSVQALRATSKELYDLIYDNTTSVQLRRGSDIKLLFSHSWPQLTSLKLRNANMCARSVTLLIKGALTGLQTLDLSRNSLQLPAVEQLAKGNWPLLSCLDLTESLSEIPLPVRVQSCQHLATSNWPALTSLHFRKNWMEAQALAELVRADWPLLQALDVSCNYCGYSPFTAQIAPWTAMQDLDLTTNRLGVSAARQLGQLRWHQLKRLQLGSCFSDLDEDSCVSAMHHVAAGMWPELTALNLSHNNLSTNSIAELIKGQWPVLRKLDISFSKPGAPGFVQELAKAPWTALQDLNLDFTQLAAQDFSLLGTLASTQITRLSLRSCLEAATDEDIRAEDPVVLTDAMQAFSPNNWPRLEALDVSNNNMVDTVIHQLTRSLSPSTSLKEVKLGGNGVACDPVSMSSWEYTSMSKWDHLSTMDLQGSILSPDEVDLLLRASPGSLDKLHITCQVDHVTSARPSRECWPDNTILYMIVAAAPSLCEVLCSLSAGVWPVTTLELAVPVGQHHEMSVEEVKELVKWNLSMLQDLHLVELGIGDPQKMPEMGRVLSSGHWPCLRKLNLKANVIDDLFVGVFVDGKWPMLEIVNLYDNEIGEDGARQLSHANWPHLAEIVLGNNDFNRRVYNNYYDAWSAMEKRLLPLFDAKWPGIFVDLCLIE